MSCLARLPADGSALVAERNSARVLQLRPGSAPVVVATINGNTLYVSDIRMGGAACTVT